MNYNNLGKSTIKVSEVSFGCMSLKADNPDAQAVINKAMDLGINFFDTADLYEFGLSEKLLGKAIEDKRQDLIIASKVGNEWSETKDAWHWNPKKEYILRAVENSLNRLRTDYIDLYQLHGGTIEDPIEETIEAFELLKEQGKIREYGISSIRPNVIREYANRSNIVSVMMQYSLLDRRPEEECIELLNQKNISVITRGTLAKGFLVGKPTKQYLGYTVAEVDLLVSEMKSVAMQLGLTLSQLSTSYVLKNPIIASAVIGFRTEDQIEELLDKFRSGFTNNSTYSHLQSILQTRLYEAHR